MTFKDIPEVLEDKDVTAQMTPLRQGGSHCCAIIIYAYAVQGSELGEGETTLSTECQGKAA